MRIGFLGHNGFALGDQCSPVLIDPILLPRFGEEYTTSPVEVYPPRCIDLAKMPMPAAVLITHEHSDHFHLPSLDKLDRSVPILVGPLMIEPVVRCIEALGFRVQRPTYGESMRVGSLLLTLYPSNPGTVLWESRVSQIYVRDVSEPELGGVYLCVDALLSQHFIDDIAAGQIPAPAMLAVSNNAQVTPAGVFGSLDNMRSAELAEGAAQQTAFAGLDILHQVLVSYFDEAREVRGAHLLICGGGFLKDYDQMGPFPFSEQKELAAVARQLMRDVQVIGPEPGDVLAYDTGEVRTTGRLEWLGVDQKRFQMLRERRTNFLASGTTIPMKAIISPDSSEAEGRMVQEIEQEFPYLARAILLAELGSELIALSRSDPSLGASRFVIRLLGQKGPDCSYALNLASAAFEPVADLSLEDTLNRFPYGLVVHTADFAAVIIGRLQIWDIAGVAMRSWFRGDPMTSPVGLLYNLFGEQVRPDIACQIYDRVLETLQ